MKTIIEQLENIRILNKENLIYHQNVMHELQFKIDFFAQHGFDEEKRKAEIQFEAREYLLKDYEQLFKDINNIKL